MKLSIQGSRQSHSFINTDQASEGSYAGLEDNDYLENPFEPENPFELENPFRLQNPFESGDLLEQENPFEPPNAPEPENPFESPHSPEPENPFEPPHLPEPENPFGQENPFETAEIVEESLPIPVVEDDGDYENWFEEKDPQEQLQPQPYQRPLNPKKVEFIRAFKRWTRLQKHNRPNRKQTIEFILKARTGYKRLGQRYHSYTGIIGKSRQIKQKSHCLLFQNLPEEKEITKDSKYYRHPVERLNQGPRFRTQAALHGHQIAARQYADYITREVLNFRKGEYRAAKVYQVVTNQIDAILKIELGLAHEKGLRWGWYLCEGAEGAPWENCEKFCVWPGCLGPEPSESFHRKMEKANDNINESDNLPVRFPFLSEVRGGSEKESTNRSGPGSGFNVGFDLNHCLVGLHHTVRRAQDLIYDHKSTQAFDLCRSYLEDGCEELMIHPPITTLDKAHLAFSASSAARFAYADYWSVKRRVVEIEKYMTLTVFYMLSDPKILKENTNMHFYADVKAKVHYWGEIHQLHFLMPQRSLGDLMDILSRERLKRLVRLHKNKMNLNKEELKKGYTLQIISIPTREAPKPVVSRRKHLVAKIIGRGDKVKGETNENVKKPAEGQNIFKRLWNKLLRKEQPKPAQETVPGIPQNNKKGDPDIIEMLDLHDRPEESRITWISKDGIGRRRTTPMPKFSYHDTIRKDPYHDYPPTIEYRQAVLR